MQFAIAATLLGCNEEKTTPDRTLAAADTTPAIDAAPVVVVDTTPAVDTSLPEDTFVPDTRVADVAPEASARPKVTLKLPPPPPPPPNHAKPYGAPPADGLLT